MDNLHKCLYSAPMGLGENVKFLREARELTYDAVGTAVGTDGQNIFNLEKRKSKVSKFAPALAKFFDIDLDTLTSADLTRLSPEQIKTIGKGPPRPELVRDAQRSDADKFSSDEIIELLALYQQASIRERQNILDLARSIGKRSALRWVRSGNDQT